jgi:hypothetical protein
MSIYIGPYVKASVPVIKTPSNEPWCKHCNKRRGDTNFCQDCGNPVTLKEITVKAPSPHWTVPATLVLRFASIDGNVIREKRVDYIYTIGNGRTDFNEPQEDEKKLKSFWRGTIWNRLVGATDFQHIFFKEEIAWMRARCQKEIESLCRVFGEDNVSFGWGLVTTWR